MPKNIFTKVLLVSGLVLSANSLLATTPINADDNVGTQSIVTDTTKDPIGKRVSKFEKDGHHCTATMINSKVGITSAHCSDSKFEDNANGRVYAAESALSTPFGYMDITLFNPYSNGDPLYDVALIAGKSENMTKDYSYYSKEFDDKPIIIKGINNPSDLIGEKVYSFGYPYEKSGYVQYKSEGKISSADKYNFNIDMPSYPGQSGSAVFLEKNNQLIGIIHGGTGNKTIAKIISPEISNWFNEKSSKWLEDNK